MKRRCPHTAPIQAPIQGRIQGLSPFRTTLPAWGANLAPLLELRATRGEPLLHAHEIGALLRGEAWLGPTAVTPPWPAGLTAPRQCPLQTLRDAAQLHRRLSSLSRRNLLSETAQRNLIGAAWALTGAPRFVPVRSGRLQGPWALSPETWGAAAQVHLRAEMSVRLIRAAGPHARPGDPALRRLRIWTGLRHPLERGGIYARTAEPLLRAMNAAPELRAGQLPDDTPPLVKLQEQAGPLSAFQASWRSVTQAAWQGQLSRLSTLSCLAGRAPDTGNWTLQRMLASWPGPPAAQTASLRRLKLPALPFGHPDVQLHIIACLLCLSPERQQKLIRWELGSHGHEQLQDLQDTLRGQLRQAGASSPPPAWHAAARGLLERLREAEQVWQSGQAE